MEARRIRRPRPLYEVNNMLRSYNEFHSFWVTIMPQLNKNLEVQQLYDVFQIQEESKMVEYISHSKMSIFEQVNSIFVITKKHICEMKSTIQMKKKDRSNVQEESKES